MENRIQHLYIDLETFSGFSKPTLDDIEAPGNYKDPEKIKAYKEEHLDIAWRKQALDSLKGEIVCIGFAINDEPVKTLIKTPTTTEKALMESFQDAIQDVLFPVWVGHNAKRFDTMWLWHRAVRYNLPYLRSIIPHKSNNKQSDIIDTMEVFAVNTYSSDAWYSLDAVCKFLGITGKGDMDGSKVHDEYIAGNYDKIAKYCAEDVERVRQIHKLTSE